MFLAPASDGRRSEATSAGIETGAALMLMPMVLAQLPAAGKPSKDLQRPTLVDEAIRFVERSGWRRAWPSFGPPRRCSSLPISIIDLRIHMSANDGFQGTAGIARSGTRRDRSGRHH